MCRSSVRTDVIDFVRVSFGTVLCGVRFVVVSAARRPQLWRLGGEDMVLRGGVFVFVHGDALLIWHCTVFRGVPFAILCHTERITHQSRMYVSVYLFPFVSETRRMVPEQRSATSTQLGEARASDETATRRVRGSKDVPFFFL